MKHETQGASVVDTSKRYTNADYQTWPEGERWELIDGVPQSMSPAPRRKHQRVVSLLDTQLNIWFEDKPCMPLVSPLDVYLPDADEDFEDIETVVQPDLVVICDEAKLIDEGVMGAPDFAIEVLSPTTAWRDQTEKRDLYERHGVRGFWILNPETLEVTAWTREGDTFALPRSGSLKVGMDVSIFPGFILKITSRL